MAEEQQNQEQQDGMQQSQPRNKKQRLVINPPNDEEKANISAALQNLKPKSFSLRNLLADYKDQIEASKKQGVTWEQIALVFNEKLNINLSTDSYQRAFMLLTKGYSKKKKEAAD